MDRLPGPRLRYQVMHALVARDDSNRIGVIRELVAAELAPRPRDDWGMLLAFPGLPRLG